MVKSHIVIHQKRIKHALMRASCGYERSVNLNQVNICPWNQPCLISEKTKLIDGTIYVCENDVIGSCEKGWICTYRNLWRDSLSHIFQFLERCWINNQHFIATHSYCKHFSINDAIIRLAHDINFKFLWWGSSYLNLAIACLSCRSFQWD